MPRQSSYGNSFGFQFCFLDLISHWQVYINITARSTTFTRPNRKTNGVIVSIETMSKNLNHDWEK